VVPDEVQPPPCLENLLLTFDPGRARVVLSALHHVVEKLKTLVRRVGVRRASTDERLWRLHVKRDLSLL
jgi:uncharacterized protein (DUF2236 family)